MQATPPTMNATALALMASKGYSYSYNGAWVFTTQGQPQRRRTSRRGTSCRASAPSTRSRGGRPGRPLRLRPLPAVLQRGARDAGRLRQPVHGLRADHQHARPLERRAAADPGESVPGWRQPGHRAVRPGLRPLHGPGRRRSASTSTSSSRRSTTGSTSPTSAGSGSASSPTSATSSTTGSRVPYDINLNMMDPAFRYEQKTAINAQVPNPFLQLPDGRQVPGRAAQHLHGDRRQPARALPAVRRPSRRPTPTGAIVKTHTFELRAQRPFVKGLSFVASYAYNNEQRQEWFDDLANYKVLTSGGKDGWEWRPMADVPFHRFTGAVTWQIPVGKDRALRLHHADGARLRHWRLAVLAGDAPLLGAAAAVHDQLRRERQPQARQPDARQVVRHVDVLRWRTPTRRAATRTTTTG